MIINYPMAFLKHSNLKKLLIDDQLHTTAIDFVFLELAPKDIVSIQGVSKKNNRQSLINGTHNISYGKDETGQTCYIRATCDKNVYAIEFVGDEPTKSLTKVINAKRMKITNESFIREIDLYVMKEKNMLINGGFVMDVVPFPMDDIYAINNKNEKGYIILQKESKDDKQSYTIDVVGDYYTKIIEEILNGNGDRVRVVNYSVINDNLFARSMDKIPLQNIYECQQTIVDYVINAYTTSHTKNITILISGPPNTGKSTVAFWIAQIMKKKLAVNPYLIKGFNVNCAEMQYHPIINHYSPKNSSPAILLLDEFDIAMKNANVGSDKNPTAISANKTNLNNFLDAINDEQFLVTVATTNVPINEINNQFAVYCRNGRFNKHFEIQSIDMVTMTDPL